MEKFVKDMIRLSKATNRGRDHHRNKPTLEPPTVGDFVQLLKKHQHAAHRFIFHCAKNGPEVTGWFQEYVRKAASYFRRPAGTTSPISSSSGSKRTTAAGALTGPLTDLFTALPKSKQSALLPVLSAYSLYLSKLHSASAIRLSHVLASPASRNPALMSSAAPSRNSSRASSPAPSHTATMPLLVPSVDPGPGAFLARWQALLEGGTITPAKAEGGPVRSGASGSVLKAGRASEPSLQRQKTNDSVAEDDDDDAFHDAFESLDELGLEEKDKAPRPDTSEVVKALGGEFRKLLGQRGCSW